MTRRSTWEADLSAYIASRRDASFEWGKTDCAMFFAGAVLAMTGDDPAEPFRDKYDSEMGAAKALLKYGAGTLEATLDALFEPIPTGFIRRGDGVWNGEAVGVCVGEYALFMGRSVTAEGQEIHEGLIRVPRAEWNGGWRV